MMPSMMNLLLLLAAVLQMMGAAAEDFEVSTGADTIRAQARDPFKEGYFNMIISCFALMFFFIACMFSVRICLGNKRGNDSQSFFLVA